MTQEIEYFFESLKKDLTFTDANVLQFRDGKWRGLDGIVITQEISAAAKGISGSKRFVRVKNPSRAVFLLKSSKIAVIKPVAARTKDQTLAKTLTLLDDILQSSSSNYHARHDELTGVLNRHGIKTEIEKAFSTLSKPEDAHNSEKKAIGPTQFTVMAFDIDRFKSVNDTYGHAVGDYVLSVFANKVQDVVKGLCSSYSGIFIFGRPGGEEFELTIIGNLTSEDRKKIGDAIIEVIRKPLAANSYSNILIPASAKPEIVTASIGISTRRIAAGDTADKLHSTLRNEADAALYRAKADGRDRIREYDEIRNRHGRVIEHNLSSDLVQLDIGSKVGVTRGDTYNVFYPPYSGEQNMFENGPGTKILGKYPAVASATLRVISVEQNISTAVVTEKQSSGEIPKGSSLRYVYMGSLRDKLFKRVHESPTTGSFLELDQHLQTVINNSKLEALFVLRASILKGETRPRDVVRTEFLSLCYLFFPPNSCAFYSHGADFYVTVKRRNDVRSNFEELAEQLKEKWDKIGYTVSAGVCVIDDLPDSAPITPETLIFYCNATLHAQEKTGEISFFDELVPVDCLYEWRQKARVDDAIVDFQNFRKLGFSSPNLFNQVGLAIYENDIKDQYTLAEASLSRAIEVDNADPVYQANLALLLTKLGKHKKAFEIFKSVESFVDANGEGYLMSYAKSSMESYKDGFISDKSFLSDLFLRVLTEYSNKRLSAFYAVVYNEIKTMMSSGKFD